MPLLLEESHRSLALSPLPSLESQWRVHSVALEIFLGDIVTSWIFLGVALGIFLTVIGFDMFRLGVLMLFETNTCPAPVVSGSIDGYYVLFAITRV